MPPQGAAGLLPAFTARQVPVGPVRGQEGLGWAPRQSPRPVPLASGVSLGQGWLLLPSQPSEWEVLRVGS